MKHKMWYDTNLEILFLEFTSDYIKTDVPEIEKKIAEMLDGKPYRQMLIRISNVYKVENRETRELSNKALEKAGISEVAFVGGSAANRIIAKVLIKTGAVKTKGEFFKTEEDAINWIKSKR